MARHRDIRDLPYSGRKLRVTENYVTEQNLPNKKEDILIQDRAEYRKWNKRRIHTYTECEGCKKYLKKYNFESQERKRVNKKIKIEVIEEYFDVSGVSFDEINDDDE